MKSEVYSWRLDPELKGSLERAASARRSSVAALLDRIVRSWLAEEAESADDEAVQARLHAEAAKSFGTLRGGDPRRASEASERVRQKLRERHAARRPG